MFLYKGNCKGSQKEDENMESCTIVHAHTRGKAAFLLYRCTLMLLMGSFNMLLLLTSDLLWKKTLLENQIVRSSLDFPAFVYNLSNFIGILSWSANVNLHAFFHYYLITFWLLFIWFPGKYSAKFVSILLYCRKGIWDAIMVCDAHAQLRKAVPKVQ